MSSTSDSQSELLANEELVAYLDGELPPEESRRVEERLANDADYRQQLRDLDQAWEALDALPATQVDDHFARTTIEMVTVAAQRDVTERTAQVSAKNRRRAAWWIAAAVAVAALGFAATRWLLPDPNEVLIANLPVIQQLDVLSQVDNVEFLRTLAAQVPSEKLAPDPVAIDRELEAWNTVSESSPSERRQWLADLPPAQKATLAERANRYSELAKNPERQQQLRHLEQAIRKADDAEVLQPTLLAYGSWLADRPAGEQEDLRVRPAAERIELIKRYVREDQERALRHLSPEDAGKLRSAVFAAYENRRDDFERAMRRRERDVDPRLEGPEWRRAWLVVLWDLLWNDDKDDERERQLIAALSAEQQEYWRSLPERGRHNRREQLVQWIRESMRPRWGPEELEKFFTETLNNPQRERLLTLPQEQMQAQLERMYLAHTLGVQDAAEWLNEFGPGAGLPPGPPPGRGGPGRGRDGRWRDRDRRDNDDRRGAPDGRDDRRDESDGERSGERRDGRRPPPDNAANRQPPPDNAPPPRPDTPPPGD
jgi:anti-sigma-K factor RskA